MNKQIIAGTGIDLCDVCGAETLDTGGGEGESSMCSSCFETAQAETTNA